MYKVLCEGVGGCCEEVHGFHIAVYEVGAGPRGGLLKLFDTEATPPTTPANGQPTQSEPTATQTRYLGHLKKAAAMADERLEDAQEAMEGVKNWLIDVRGWISELSKTFASTTQAPQAPTPDERSP